MGEWEGRFFRVVGPVRVRRPADDGHVRPDGLDGVVRVGEQRLVRGCRDVGAARVELRLPIVGRVGLVPDDERLDVRKGEDDVLREGRELRLEDRVLRRLERVHVVDRDHRTDPARLGGGGCVPELRGDDRVELGVARDPLRRHADRVEAGLLREVHLGGRVAPDRAVLGGAHEEVGAGERGRREDEGGREDREKSKDAHVLSIGLNP